jgi:putative transposase
MTYNPEKHHRRSIRLKGYNYASPGAYFVTICVQERECVLGDVVNGEMVLNDLGEVVGESWSWLA